MAGDYNTIGRPEYGNVLQRAMDMDQAGAVSTLGHELQASVGVFDRPEWLAHAGIRLVGAGTLLAAGANGGHMRVRNPATSGVITVIDLLDFVCSSAANMSIRVNQLITNLAANVGPTARDVRWPFSTGLGTGPGPTICSATNEAALAGAVIYQTTRAAYDVVLYQRPIVLAPGWACDFGSETVGVAGLSVAYYERPIGQKELTIG